MSEKRTHSDARPDPDAFLVLARQESPSDRRGRLKVFLGAAPGVGKTYAILQAARRLKDEGTDVVLGLVETHGRADTEGLTAGLEILPRRFTEGRSKLAGEFDLDAALARRPTLLVVDELAHSNPPGGRHPKRWQDVEELLDAGIDVWTALNIQHLESLADLVSRVTGVTVRETVPDRFVQNADDVVVVDLTPEELIERLQAGKVYVPETARRATQNFFTVGNLTALRELALRRTAARVDDQMAEYLRQKAIDGPWGTGERLLVCVGPDTEALVRKCGRLATALNAGWIAVHLEQPGADPGDARGERQIGAILHLAETLGAETTRLQSRDFPTDLLAFARRENVTQIIVGVSAAPFWARLLRGTLAERLMRRAGDIAVLVVTDAEPVRWRLRLAPGRPGAWAMDGAIATLSVGLALLTGWGLSLLMPLPNLSMIFLASVMISAVARGTRSAILAAVLSFLAYNFFFIEPRFTLTVARGHEFFALLIFLAVAALTGFLAGQARTEAKSALKSASTARSLADFSRRLSAAATAEDVTWVAVNQLHKLLDRDAVILLRDDVSLVLSAAWPPTELADAAEMSAARWAYEKAEMAGMGTGTLPTVRFRFQPLTTPEGTVGVLGVTSGAGPDGFSAEQERSLAAIADQTAIALERAKLVGEAVKTAALAENDRIREALLASLSHDLRTPLASITGAVTTMRELGAELSDTDRTSLLETVETESASLTRLVTNLLDMSRIEAGAMKVRRDWVDAADTIRAAVERGRKAFPDLYIRLSIAPGLPYLRGDSQLLGQVLFNLLDNAHKYGGAAPVSVHARREGGAVVISVTDEGPGIKPTELERVFDKFYRAGGSDGRRPGTGLGLSICRGLVEAMGGRIHAESPAVRRRGTRIVLRLPVPEKGPARTEGGME